MWTQTSSSTRSSSKVSRNSNRPANSPSSRGKDREAVNLRARIGKLKALVPEHQEVQTVVEAEVEIILRAPAAVEIVQAVHDSRKKRKMMAAK